MCLCIHLWLSPLPLSSPPVQERLRWKTLQNKDVVEDWLKYLTEESSTNIRKFTCSWKAPCWSSARNGRFDSVRESTVHWRKADALPLENTKKRMTRRWRRRSPLSNHSTVSPGPGQDCSQEESDATIWLKNNSLNCLEVPHYIHKSTKPLQSYFGSHTYRMPGSSHQNSNCPLPHWKVPIQQDFQLSAGSWIASPTSVCRLWNEILTTAVATTSL